MPKKPTILPQGVTICGWCESMEARADLAIAALERIVDIEPKAFYDQEGLVHRVQGIARAAIAALRSPAPPAHEQQELT